MIKLALPIVALMVSIPFYATPAAAATESGVVNTCSKVLTSNHADGTCVAAVSSYLTALKGTDTGDQLDQAITSLVVKLAALVPPAPSCNFFNDEIAQAINVASSFSSSGDQKARVIDISATIKACKTQTTASVGGPTGAGTLGTPGTLASTFSGGNTQPTPG